MPKLRNPFRRGGPLQSPPQSGLTAEISQGPSSSSTSTYRPQTDVNPVAAAAAQNSSPPTALGSTAIAKGINYGVSVLHDAGPKALADIVFVHGLTGNAYNTWLHKDSQTHWPSTLLIQDLPDSRVLSFGYDADIVNFWSPASKSRLSNHAEDMVGELVRLRERSETEERKIMFVVHSLGGLVVEHALSHSRNSYETHIHQIERFTCGIAFLGTPHHGSDLAKWGKFGTDIASILRRPNKDIVAVLEPGSEMLDQVESGFHTILRKRKDEGCEIAITCFWEEVPVAVIGHVVPLHSAKIQGYPCYGIHANHMDMTKFPSRADRGYDAVLGELLRWKKAPFAYTVTGRTTGEDTTDVAASLNIREASVKDHAKMAIIQTLNGDLYLSDQPYRPLGMKNFVSTVPSSKVKHYVQRPDLFHQLETELHAKLQESGENSHVVAVCGLGGAGKTQLVLDYIQRQQKDYKGLYWIDARSQTSVERGLAVLYRILYQLPATSEAVAFDEILLRVKAWFSGHSGQQDRWLLVFDNADNIEDDDGQDYVDLRSLVPPAACLHVIVTTRNSKVKELSDARPVYVGGLEVDEALKLFWMRSDIDGDRASPKNRRYAKDIVEAVGGLALAVELAAAIVSKEYSMKKDLSLYLAAYRANRQELLDKWPDKATSAYDKSILAAWETTFGYVSRGSLLAAKLLGFLTVLDPTDIYVDLFAVVLDEESQREDHRQADVFVQQIWTTVLASDTVMTMRLLERALSVLESFSLLRYDKEGETYSMHRLIHDWGLERLGRGERVAVCQAATEFLVSYIKQCGIDPNVRSRVVKHISESVRICQSNWSHFPDEVSSGLLEGFVSFEEHTDSVGRWKESETVKRFVFSEKHRILGDEHRDTISAMNNLANTLGDQGKLDEAASMKKEVLEKRRRILGDEHPDTISAMNNLANTLGDQGKLDEAASMMEEVLEKRRRILGDKHPNTISAMNNLAITLGAQGKLDEAASMKKEVLEKRRRILGDEHPNTISAMNNLANTLGDQGKLDEAASMMEEVLEKGRRILGDEHPITRRAQHILAII